MWQWNDTMDNTNLAHHTVTASRLPVIVAPQVESVDPGPPVTLLVRLLPGQGKHSAPAIWGLAGCARLGLCGSG